MTKKRTRSHANDLRGASKLAIDATKGITDVVEEMHRTIASGPSVLGAPFARFARMLTGVVYEPIRGVTTAVGAGIDAALSQLGPVLGESAPGAERDAVVSALNGVLGDYLVRTENPLAIEMAFRIGGNAFALDPDALRQAFPEARSRLLVLIHGSSMNDRQWARHGHDHGAALASEFGFSAVYLHYNSGLHISTNGSALSELLQSLVDAWPVALDEIVLLGHSMGGLVARSACHFAESEERPWRTKLRKLICLGSPHHGSPVERGGSLFESLLGVSVYSTPIARLGKIRSAGVTDLRYGNVLPEHWEGRDRFAREGDTRRDLRLPAGVHCYAIAGTTAKTLKEDLPGDGLVSVNSALGRHDRADLSLGFPEAHQYTAVATGHLDLLDRPEVYEQLRRWFAGA